MKELYMANRGKQSVNLAVCAAAIVAAARRVNAVNEIAPTEATAAAISKVAALVEEYKLVASQFKGNKKDAPAPEPEPEASAS